MHETPQQKALRRAGGGVRRSHEEYRRGVRQWLAENPATWGRPGYDDYVHATNNALPRGARPLVLGHTIMSQLQKTWPDVLLYANPNLDRQDPRWRGDAWASHAAPP